MNSITQAIMPSTFADFRYLIIKSLKADVFLLASSNQKHNSSEFVCSNMNWHLTWLQREGTHELTALFCGLTGYVAAISVHDWHYTVLDPDRL